MSLEDDAEKTDELQRQKVAAFDAIYDELFLNEESGEYSAYKPLTQATLQNIRGVVVDVRAIPGMEGSHQPGMRLANDGTAPEDEGAPAAEDGG